MLLRFIRILVTAVTPLLFRLSNYRVPSESSKKILEASAEDGLLCWHDLQHHPRDKARARRAKAGFRGAPAKGHDSWVFHEASFGSGHG